jgi:tetratricopeptide (TPR) repeat protein
VSAAEQDLIKALVSEAESLKKLNPFLVLGVGYEATDSEVRAAFGELTKRYHPDRFARYESHELRQVAAEIFILIRDAYRKLDDAVARAQVLHSLGKPAPGPRAVASPRRVSPSVPPPKPPARPSPVPQSASGASPMPSPPGALATAGSGALATPVPVAMTTGTAPTSPVPVIRPPAASLPAIPRPAELRPRSTKRPTGDPLPAVPDPRGAPVRRAATDPGAASASRRAAQSQPIPVVSGEPPDVSALEALLDQGKLDDALAAYKLMGKKHPHDRNLRAGVELCEGLRALTARDRLEAAQRFEAALEIDPSNERAARELADMRRQATNERKGLLSRLMGKKEP